MLERTNKPTVTGLDIMENCLDLPRSQQNVVTGRRISQIMEQACWERSEKRLNRQDKAGESRKVYEWRNPHQLRLEK